MAPDYYSALRKAAAGPGLFDEAARHAFYQRARRALENDLRNADPPLRETDIEAELNALHAAVARIEVELAGERRPRPVRPAVTVLPVPAADRKALRGLGVALAGALALIVMAGLGAYSVSRERARPALAGEGERVAVRTTGAPGSAQAPYILRQQRVYYRTTHPAGTVVVSRNQRFLYIVQANQVAIRYAIGVGPDCETISGLFRITGKVNEPDQGGAQAPEAGRARPGAAFGVPALYFGDVHAVHRASEPGRIGQAARSGCFQAWSQDIADLYERVVLDERVVIAN